MDELKRARELQIECKNLHLPSPPVSLWQVEIHNNKGELINSVEQKSNSYVRNAYNQVAQSVAFPTRKSLVVFGEGNCTFKSADGAVTQAVPTKNTSSIISQFGLDIFFGSGSTSDVLDDSNLQSPVSWSINGKFAPATQVTTYDGNKMITTISKILANNSGSEVSFTEVGLFGAVGISPQIATTHADSKYTFLLIRDVFSEIKIPDKSVLAFRYVTEIII